MKKRQNRKRHEKISEVKVRKNTWNRKKGKRKYIKHKIRKKGNNPCDRGIMGDSVSSFIQYTPSSRGGTDSSHDNKQHQLDNCLKRRGLLILYYTSHLRHTP